MPRLFITVCVAVLFGLAPFAPAPAEGPPTLPKPPALGPVHEFVGVSNSGSVDEALRDALRKLDKALASSGIADNQATWRLVEVTGRQGGIAAPRTNETRVKIAAKYPIRKKGKGPSPVPPAPPAPPAR